MKSKFISTVKEHSRKLLLTGLVVAGTVASTALTGCVETTASRGGYYGGSSYTQGTPLQNHYLHEREDLFRHQQNELRRYGSSQGLWNHQQRERHGVDHHQGLH